MFLIIAIDPCSRLHSVEYPPLLPLLSTRLHFDHIHSIACDIEISLFLFFIFIFQDLHSNKLRNVIFHVITIDSLYIPILSFFYPVLY